jgi:cytochrome c-type biogenesis protein CcmE
VVPNLFTDGAFVVVEGGLADDGHFDASSLVIKHENEFFSDTPPPDSPSANLLQEE